MAFSAFGELIAKYNSSLPTITDGSFSSLQLSVNGELLTKINVALPTGSNVIGALSANQSVNMAQINGVTPLMGNGVSGTGAQRVVIASDNTAFTVNAAQSGTWNITNISGTVSLPTGAATEASLAKLTLAQASATAGQTGALILGAVTTGAPTYTTAQSNPLSLTTSGLLRVDASGTTVPVSLSTVAVTNAGTFAVQDTQVIADNAAFTDGTTKTFLSGYIFDEVAGTALTENDAAAARIDSKRAQVHVLEDATTRGQRASISAAGALKVDGSAATQPVSAASLPLPTGAATEASLAKLTIAQNAALGTNTQALVGGSVTTSAPTYTTGNIQPLSLDTAGNLRVSGTFSSTAAGEVGTAADASSASGTGTPIGIVTGSMTDLVTIAVGVGSSYYITGLTMASDNNCAFELVEYNGTTVTTWYRSGLINTANPTISMVFPEAIKKVGNTSHSIKIRAQALVANCNAMAAINGYTR